MCFQHRYLEDCSGCPMDLWMVAVEAEAVDFGSSYLSDLVAGLRPVFDVNAIGTASGREPTNSGACSSDALLLLEAMVGDWVTSPFV